MSEKLIGTVQVFFHCPQRPSRVLNSMALRTYSAEGVIYADVQCPFCGEEHEGIDITMGVKP